jgi:hypothetical protein
VYVCAVVVDACESESVVDACESESVALSHAGPSRSREGLVGDEGD